jgi:hypothetical protein
VVRSSRLGLWCHQPQEGEVFGGGQAFESREVGTAATGQVVGQGIEAVAEGVELGGQAPVVGSGGRSVARWCRWGRACTSVCQA